MIDSRDAPLLLRDWQAANRPRSTAEIDALIASIDRNAVRAAAQVEPGLTRRLDADEQLSTLRARIAADSIDDDPQVRDAACVMQVEHDRLARIATGETWTVRREPELPFAQPRYSLRERLEVAALLWVSIGLVYVLVWAWLL